MIILRELKSRKAKFGFDYGTLALKDVIPLAEFLNNLHNTYAETEFTLSEGGYNRPSIKIYTDSESVAKWIRLNSTI